MKFYFKKFIDFLSTLFLVAAVTFLTFQLLPGNPALAILGPEAEQAQIEAMEETLELNKPLVLRFFSWLKGVFSGNLGISYKYNEKVSFLIKNALKNTASLAILTLIFTVASGVFSGIFFARFRKNKFVSGLTFINQLWISVPTFCTALLLILIFTVFLNILPSVGFFGLKSLILPALSISLGSGAILSRYVLTSIKNELKQDYVRTAKSKGLSEKQIIFRHILKNSLIPSITTLGLITAEIFGGSIIIENVFSLPGIGRLITTSISSRDFPLLQGLTLYLAGMTLTCNFAVDILYSVIDPRVRQIRRKSSSGSGILPEPKSPQARDAVL